MHRICNIERTWAILPMSSHRVAIKRCRPGAGRAVEWCRENPPAEFDAQVVDTVLPEPRKPDFRAHAAECSPYNERLLDDPNSGIRTPAAMILGPVPGEGGVIPTPEDWLCAMRRITRERGIPVIIDEVQTGLGRTGSLYAFEQDGIVPDILVLSKAIGGGLPLSVVVYRSALDRWQPRVHAGTFRGNQLAMAVGSATIRIIHEQRLEQHVIHNPVYANNLRLMRLPLV
ncbi:MAG: aminotransferase class III-fold pyridoxal phosphate-dependent enzyme [Methylococcales bacterium]